MNFKLSLMDQMSDVSLKIYIVNLVQALTVAVKPKPLEAQHGNSPPVNVLVSSSTCPRVGIGDYSVSGYITPYCSGLK